MIHEWQPMILMMACGRGGAILFLSFYHTGRRMNRWKHFKNVTLLLILLRALVWIPGGCYKERRMVIRMRKWIINMGILTGIWLTLAGCGAPKAQVIMEAETAAADGTETQAGQELLGDPKERAEETVSFLEQFESSLSFQDMDRERAAAYGGPLEDSYAFYGRETEDGAGYVLGIKIRKESLLDGLTVYGEDDHMEAVIQNDQDGGYDTVYELDGISVFLSGSSQNGVLNEVLYLQPEDLETPEELLNAFDLGYCHGAAGAAYVRDVLERQVRFTPPDTEAYLAVEVERDRELCTEYVPLTREEEREILDSKEPVPLEDGDRLEFFVSQETYEEQDIDGGAVTAPALRIAEERCGFRPSYIEPDMDIEKKEETREEAEKENEGEAGEETGEENEEAREEAGEESEEAREEAGERAREAMENGEADGD